MSYDLLRADARSLPLADESVDLIVTSPPYFGQRTYQDHEGDLDGQLGNEPTPTEFLEALWAVTAECWRVLKPSGSLWVNLGDKRAGSGAPGTTSGLSRVGSTLQGTTQQDRGGAGQVVAARQRVQGDRAQMRGGTYTKAWFGRRKGRQMLPERYAIGCADGLADPEGVGWIVRQVQVWEKANGLPESVTDRTRDTHEYWFHLTKSERYFAGLDIIREELTGGSHASGANAAVTRWESGNGVRHRTGRNDPEMFNPLGRLPGSVWRVATEPLQVPEHIGVDHFAAFPSEWPRRIVLGWSPSGICTACGEGRRPLTQVEHDQYRDTGATGRPKRQDADGIRATTGWNTAGYPQTRSAAVVLGEVCACTPFTDHPDRARPSVTPGAVKRQDDAARAALGEPRRHGNDWPRRAPRREYDLEGWAPPPTRAAVVLDPFGGTGTTAAVAHALGRHGISVDLSAAYHRLALWRIQDSGLVERVQERTYGRRLTPAPPAPGQEVLFA